MPITGVIADITRSKIPEAWQMCLSHPGVGESGLQRNIDLVKFILFDSVVAPELEVTEYNPLVLEYAGILAAVRIVPSAAEIINNASFQRTMFGNKNQQETYLNRYENLLQRRKDLLAEANDLLPMVQEYIPETKTTLKKRSPILYTEYLEGAITDDPNLFDYTFDQRNTAEPVERDNLE